ncbi:MAG TPA: BON domain-containing protein [Pyrinomonadaceae bacterium]|nr:BON domain-containing protein [Pyrinomonadaceae bacterium]
MPNRYDDREYDRGERSGRNRDSEYGSSSNRTQERYRWGREDDDDDRENRYAGESRWGGQYGRSRSGGERESGSYRGGQDRGGRGEYDRGWESGGGEHDRSRFGAYTGGGYMGGGSIGSGYTGGGYGYTSGGGTSGRMGETGYGSQSGGYGSTGGGWTGSSGDRYTGGGGGGSQRGFGESSNRYSQRYDYPSDSPSRGMYGNQGERPFDYDRSRYGRGQEGGYEYDRDRYGSQGGQGGEERGWWDRASDAVASWFGDEEAERRRRMDRREEWRGKGPKGYRRSDERIREDVSDRLSEGYLDASDVEVTVSNAEVTLTGTVNNRWDKRRAEDVAESVNGVTHVENRIRVKQHSGSQAYGEMTTTGTTSRTGVGSDTSTASMGAGGVGTHGTTGTGTTGTETSTGTTGGATSSSSAAAGGTGTRAKS